MVVPVYRYGYWGQLFRPLSESRNDTIQNNSGGQRIRNQNPRNATGGGASNGRSRLEGRLMDERHLEMAEQFQAEQLLRAIEKARNATQEPTGLCLNCEAKVEGTRKFCDSECREDYELRQKVTRKQFA